MEVEQEQLEDVLVDFYQMLKTYDWMLGFLGSRSGIVFVRNSTPEMWFERFKQWGVVEEKDAQGHVRNFVVAEKGRDVFNLVRLELGE